MLSRRDMLTLVAIEERLVGDDPAFALRFDRRMPSWWVRARDLPFPALVAGSLVLMIVFAVLALPIALLISAALLPCVLLAHLCSNSRVAHRRSR